MNESMGRSFESFAVFAVVFHKPRQKDRTRLKGKNLQKLSDASAKRQNHATQYYTIKIPRTYSKFRISVCSKATCNHRFVSFEIKQRSEPINHDLVLIRKVFPNEFWYFRNTIRILFGLWFPHSLLHCCEFVSFIIRAESSRIFSLCNFFSYIFKKFQRFVTYLIYLLIYLVKCAGLHSSVSKLSKWRTINTKGKNRGVVKCLQLNSIIAARKC